MTKIVQRAAQARNEAGGTTVKVDAWTFFDRFLILGTFGTYYTRADDQTLTAIASLRELVRQDAPRFVERCRVIGVAGRAVKSEPVLLALAVAWKHAPEVRPTIAEHFGDVCRIGTHLFEWVAAAEAVGCGYGRRMRRLLAGWYHRHAAQGDLDLQLAKYQQRNGWSHRDVLRLAHVEPLAGSDETALFPWVVRGDASQAIGCARGMELLKTAGPDDIATIIGEYRLSHEMVPTELRDRPEVWEALLPRMPYMALTRNLNKLTSLGVAERHESEIVARLSDREAMLRQRVHPFRLLLAWKTYALGHGLRGKLTWTPRRALVQALEAAFYVSFGLVEATGKRYLLALDVSSSMMAPIADSPVSCAEAECALAMATVAAEGTRHVDVVLFRDRLTEIDSRELHDRQIGDVWHSITRHGFGGTDCSLPFVWAQEQKRQYDVVVIYTDCQSWMHDKRVDQVIAEYRRQVPQAKAVCVSMTATRDGLLPLGDPGCLELVGFDADGPSAIGAFVAG